MYNSTLKKTLTRITLPTDSQFVTLHDLDINHQYQFIMVLDTVLKTTVLDSVKFTLDGRGTIIL